MYLIRENFVGEKFIRGKFSSLFPDEDFPDKVYINLPIIFYKNIIFLFVNQLVLFDKNWK